MSLANVALTASDGLSLSLVGISRADLAGGTGNNLYVLKSTTHYRLTSGATMSTTTITPYLFFAGRCEEALNFYREAIGAQIDMIMRFNESPDPIPPGMLQAGFDNKVMHSSFRIGDVRLMASDGCDEKSKFDGFQLALAVPNEADAHKAFNALAAGGIISMPLCKTFWSPCYGMVTDKFNVGWMVLVSGEQPT